MEERYLGIVFWLDKNNSKSYLNIFVYKERQTHENIICQKLIQQYNFKLKADILLFISIC